MKIRAILVSSFKAIMEKIIVLIVCKDRSGIIASVTNFIASNSGNIVYIDQHVDRENSLFFMRLETEFEHDDFAYETFKQEFATTLVTKFEMKWRIYKAEVKPKLAIFVSKYDHCLYDLLGRYASGELHVDIPFILSNHQDLSTIAHNFRIPFHHIEVTKEHKAEASNKQLDLLKSNQVDCIVLARYMQIIPKALIDVYPNKIINIHHSFLPAFVGAKPYHSAYKRGVKIIGATSHYVTEELDAGPIIAQDVAHVSHTHSIDDLIAKGRDLEKIVLSNAVKMHLQRKVLVHGNKTIVFS